MRRNIFIANWKMHKTVSESIRCATELKTILSGKQEHEIVICPPYTAMFSLEVVLQDCMLFLGAQNVHEKEYGAYTGEVSARMLEDAGCDFVIIGHSERRQYFAEDEAVCSEKIKTCLEHGLIPVYCVGENNEQNQASKTFEVIEHQLQQALRGIEDQDASQLVIAYEPVWAIGTGRAATPEWAEKVHAFIREKLGLIFRKDISSGLRILYGGSVNRDNVDALMSQSNIDGALVGGASLDAEHFARIVKYGE